MPDKMKNNKGIGTGTGLIIGISAVFILLGLALLLIPTLSTAYIIYGVGIVLFAFGVIQIVLYFLNKNYEDIRKYGFSGGMLCLLVGIFILIKGDGISAFVPLFLGICILLMAIIKLQASVDLKIMKNGGWLPFLILAVAFLCIAVFIILDPLKRNSSDPEYIYYILVADGAWNLFCTIYLVFAIKHFQKSGLNVPIQPKVDLLKAESGSDSTKDNAEDAKKADSAETEKKDANVQNFPSDEEIILSVFNPDKKNEND